MATLDGKDAVITGASSGIGEAAALQFGRAGAKVVVAARREDKGQAVVSRVQEDGGEAVFVKTDVTKREDIERLIDTSVKTYGRVDFAINNAGVVNSVMVPTAEIPEEDWDVLMNTNLKGVWLSMKYQIPVMISQGSGVIVNISSIYGFKASPIGAAHYLASKHAVIGLSKTAAIDYGQQGIRINVVSPGFTHSEMVDPFLENAPDLMKDVIQRHSGMNRVGLAEESADAMFWLGSDGARFVNGAVIPVDGGDTSRLY